MCSSNNITFRSECEFNRYVCINKDYDIEVAGNDSCSDAPLGKYILNVGSQIRSQLSASSLTNRPQPKVIITKVMIKIKLKLAAGCELKIVAELSSCP